MKKIFVSYGGNWAYEETLKRIKKEAHSLGIFDKVITYTPRMMPPFIQSSSLKAFDRGDGYWLWKPYIVWKTLQQYPDAVVVYSDAGCKLQPRMDEWNHWFKLAEEYDTLAFRYRSDFSYQWEQEINCKTTEREWTKKSMIEYFDSMMGDRKWLNNSQCWSGLIIAKNPKNVLIRMWMDLALLRPDLFYEAFGQELLEQDPLFIEHRHDQSVWSAIVTYYEMRGKNVKVLAESAESDSTSAVVAARIKRENKPRLKCRIINILKAVLGQNAYIKLRRLIIV